MLYEKRLLVLSGSGSGCVRLERTSSGTGAVLSVNNISGNDFLIIVRDDNGLLTFVPTTLARPFSFTLPASTELSRITVIVAAGEKLLLSGTLGNDRLWQGNLEDEIRRARKLLGQRPPKRSVSDFFFDIMTPESYDDNRVAEVNYYRSNLSVDKDDIAATLDLGAPSTQPPPPPPAPKDTYKMSDGEYDEQSDDFENDKAGGFMGDKANDLDETPTGDFAPEFPETEYIKPDSKKASPSDEFVATAGDYSFEYSFIDMRNVPPPPAKIPPANIPPAKTPPADVPPAFGVNGVWTSDNNAPPYTGQVRHGLRGAIQPEPQTGFQSMRQPEPQTGFHNIRSHEPQAGFQNIRQPEPQNNHTNMRPPEPQNNHANMRPTESRPEAIQPLQTPEAVHAAPPIEPAERLVPPPISQPPPILGSAAFYDTVKPQIEKLFAKNEHYGALERLLPESKWIRVDYDNKGKFYLIGLIGEPVRYICYGVPGKYSPRPPAELAGYCQWLAIDENDPIGEGFWVMYQDAFTGKSIL